MDPAVLFYYKAGNVGNGKERESKSRKNLPPGRPKKIFRRDEALELRKRGFTFRQIGEKLGVPFTTIATALRPKP